MKNQILFPALLAIFVSGCASTPPPPTAKNHHGLYSGQPAAVFATEMPAASAEEALQRGDNAARQGNLDLALYLYVMSLEMDDARPDAFYKIGRIHGYRGNTSLAIKAYEEAITRAPDHARAQEELGLLLLGERQYDGAERALSAAVALDPQRPRVHNGLGVIADLRGDHDAAVGHFEAALAIEPTSVQTLNNLGYSRYLAGNWTEAERIFRQVLGLDPDHALATRNLGLLCARRERYDEALALLERVMKPAEAYNDIGYIAMLEGHHEQARALLNEAIRRSPSYYELAYENLARNEELARQNSDPPPEQAAYEPDAEYDAPQPASPEELPASAATEQGWIIAKSLDVHAAATEESDRLDSIHRGKLVHVLTRGTDWLYVWYWDHSSVVARERRGWIRSGYMTDKRQEVALREPDVAPSTENAAADPLEGRS